VLEVCDETKADLVVLSWDQNLTDGRARVVTEVLRSSRIPVLLLPATPTTASEVDLDSLMASLQPAPSA
jgi:hypothetical protein